MIEIIPFHKSIIICLILSDIILTTSKLITNVSLIFLQSLYKFEYFRYVFLILIPYCNRYLFYQEQLIKVTIIRLIGFNNLRLTCFIELYKFFYYNNNIIIP